MAYFLSAAAWEAPLVLARREESIVELAFARRPARTRKEPARLLP